ncbi:FAD-dependent oxidoreductase [Microlunatus spumicola]|uniref:FAD-dependent oxidoreductase n=1 Tax=Microlunatus spumicola TaxID=81499 RepID=A0ABP6WIC9_9ACTN
MRKILIVGGGYAGFYTAWHLERRLKPGEAEVVVVDPRPYMTYQPFLPEVAAGGVEARHAAVSLRRHLNRTTVVPGTVTALDHAARRATVELGGDGGTTTIGYDVVVVTAGAVTRRLPVPGVGDHAIGLKHVEEAVAVRDRLLVSFDLASVLPPGPERQRLLTVVVVGGGFTGVEGFGELLSLATALLEAYPTLSLDDLGFHLVEGSGRILPEVSPDAGAWVVDHLRRRGAHVHLETFMTSAEDGHVVLSDGTTIDTDLIVSTAGNAAPVVARHTDLPVNGRGLVVVRADLRVGTDDAPVEDAWAAGDDAAVPDLASSTPGALTVPNAQHAVRQGRLLARNLVAVLRGRPPKPYVHHNLGVVATLGLGRGIFQSGPVTIKGFPAWVLHRGYHVLAVPTWERKVRVLAVWLPALLFGRDIVSLQSVQHPRAAFLAAGQPGDRAES